MSSNKRESVFWNDRQWICLHRATDRDVLIAQHDATYVQLEYDGGSVLRWRMGTEPFIWEASDKKHLFKKPKGGHPLRNMPRGDSYVGVHLRYEVSSARRAAHLSFEELAKAVRFPGGATSIARWERDGAPLDPHVQRRIVDYFGFHEAMLVRCQQDDAQVYREDYEHWVTEPHRPFLEVFDRWYELPKRQPDPSAWAFACAQACWLPVSFYPTRARCLHVSPDGESVEVDLGSRSRLLG